MGTNRIMKKSFLCVDDYGMGGIWYVVLSESWERIAEKLPFLICVENRPDWMDQQHYEKIAATGTFDIDNLPTEGILGLTLQERMRRFRGEPSQLSSEQASQLINDLLKKHS